MEIGSKIKNARNEASYTQERAAEALGVSRQTISNWENGRSYPDIVSVIKMSDLYSVSLEHLLKEEMGMEDKYLAYLEESTNKVRSNDRLAKAALIAAVLFIYAMTQRIFWSAAQGMDLTNYTVEFKYILLPMSALLLSVYAGKGDWWGKWKWALTAIIGGLFLLVPSVSFARFDEGSAMMTFIFPNIRYLFAGCAVSVIGLLLGERVHRK